MRYAGAMIVAIAVVATACTETADQTADADSAVEGAEMIDADTVGTNAAGSPTGGDAPSPSDTPPTSASDTPSTQPPSEAPDAPPEDTGDDVAASIPSRFHGEWNADLAACGTGSSVTRLRISADQLRFYESTASVREVDIESARVITVSGQYQGEGDTWQDERRLSLSEDGNSLTVSNGSELVRYRCP